MKKSVLDHPKMRRAIKNWMWRLSLVRGKNVKVCSLFPYWRLAPLGRWIGFN